MPLVPHRNKFVYKLAAQNEHGCLFWACLRLIFPRASDLPRLFQKAYGKCVFKSGGGMCIYFVLHKNKCSTYQNGPGGPWSQAVAMFLRSKNSRPEVYTDVHFWTGYFKRLTAKRLFRTAMEGGGDVRGSTQQRVCFANT